MMNKLIFSKRLIMDPYLDELEHYDDRKIKKAIKEASAEYSSVLDQQNVIMKLGEDGVLDSATYQNVLYKLDQEKTNLSRRKDVLISSLMNSSVYTAEAGKLDRFLKKASITRTMDNHAFSEFVDEVIVYSRAQIGFKLKCGLLLKEELS